MSWLTSFALYLFHSAYTLFEAISIFRRRIFASKPQPLNVQRRQIPKHLALLLASDESISLDVWETDLVEDVEHVVTWCREAGIHRLTVYDRQGMLSSLSSDIKDRLSAHNVPLSHDSTAESDEVEYPLTPPPSDGADSRPLSPNDDFVLKTYVSNIVLQKGGGDAKRRCSNSWNVLKRRRVQKKEAKQEQPFMLHIVSRKSGKPAIANVAAAVLRERTLQNDLKPSSTFQCCIDDVSRMLEGTHGFACPDLMIIHDLTPSFPSKALELDGFPPWHIRLTEFSYTRNYSVTNPSLDTECSSISRLDEEEFRRALDEYASAEMRLGK